MGGRRVSLLLTVALLGVAALGNPVENHNNETEIEGEFLEDILGKWLKDFGTYTYMVDQDTDEGEDEGGRQRVTPEVTSVVPENGDDEENEDYEQGSSAPISMNIEKATGLLNPDLDYTVKLESLVAEGGSVLVTLGSFHNKSSCGVGGFTLQPEDMERGGQEGRLNITHQQEGNRSTTIVAFAVDNEAENSTAWQSGDEGSAWEDLSQNLWWARGKLAGGGLLTLTFTPPECGCLVLKAHYGFPIGDNLTLVVGPETYPRDLEKLICVDPAIADTQENLIEAEVDEEGVTQEIRELISSAQDEEDEDAARSVVKVGRGRGRWASRQAAKKLKRERKRRRQEARQAIRQAGKRVTKKRVMKHMRLQRRHDESEDNVENRPGNPQAGRQGGGGKWARKQARKAARKHAKQAKKAWKRQRKNGRRGKHHRRNRFNKNQNATEDAAESIEDHLNTTLAPTDEDAAADILLSDDGELEEEDSEAEGGAAAGEGPNRRRGRKQRRQRGKPKNKLQNKDQRKGIKFCCKRGIKFKKSHFGNSSNEGEQPDVSCSDTDDIISTYAQHQFGIDKAQCAARFETCCTKFSPQVWEKVQAKKASRKAKRKQQRKARQQRRRQQRQQTSTTAAA